MQVEKLTTKNNLSILEQKKVISTNSYSIILEAIDESFAIYINSKKFNIFLYLEEEYGLNKQNILNNINKFVDIVENLFGSGAQLIEIKIIELINKKICAFAYNPPNGELIFKKYLVELLYFLKINQ